jgi:hypothetical protein
VSAGSTTIEFGVRNIDKGVSIECIHANLSKILPHYKPGEASKFNALAHNTAVCMDADGTIGGKPLKGDTEGNPVGR